MIPHTVDIPAGMSTKVFVQTKGALADLPAVLNEMFPGKRPWILEDDNTKAAAGNKVFEILEANGFKPYPPHVLPGSPKPHPLVSLSEDELFYGVYVDIGGYGVAWNDSIDISSEELWENGIDIESTTNNK